MDKLPKTRVTISNGAEAVWMDRAIKRYDTQKEYAEWGGVPAWVVSDWETGRETPTYPIPHRIWPESEFVLSVDLDIALRFERWRRGITMDQLGALLGVSKQTINDWENLRYGWTNLAQSWGLTWK
jgi:DNA-binding transcriptional regulator YiaG